MTYSNSRFQIKDAALNGGVATFIYQTNKPRADMDVTGYFADAADAGTKLGDLVFVRRSGQDDVDIHRFIAFSGRAGTTRYLKTVNGEVFAQSDTFRNAMPLILPLSISQAAFDALSVKDPNTLYLIPSA